MVSTNQWRSSVNEAEGVIRVKKNGVASRAGIRFMFNQLMAGFTTITLNFIILWTLLEDAHFNHAGRYKVLTLPVALL